jgi:hypothetical protein
MVLYIKNFFYIRFRDRFQKPRVIHIIGRIGEHNSGIEGFLNILIDF